jgi:hypothetical protein
LMSGAGWELSDDSAGERKLMSPGEG